MTRKRILACCVPQYSAQFPRNVPSCFGSIHMLFGWFGIRSVLPASCGIQKLCATSADSSLRNVIAGFAVVLTGTCTSFAVTILRRWIPDFPPPLVTDNSYLQGIGRGRLIQCRGHDARRRHGQHEDDQNRNHRPSDLNPIASVHLGWFSAISALPSKPHEGVSQ